MLDFKELRKFRVNDNHMLLIKVLRRLGISRPQCWDILGDDEWEIYFE